MSMKETRAQMKGVTKKTVTTMKGLTGIYNTLAKEHGMVSSLMNQVLEGDIETRRELFPRIKAELLSHAHAEEQEFYAVLLQHAETRDKASHAKQEHKDIENMVSQLEGMNIESDAWLDTFETFRNSVEHHAKEEEREMFPLAKKALDKSEASNIEKRFEREKARQLSMLSAAE